MDLISIIVPIYSVESYLNKCIDSIINQTYKNLEIILVDDGSPDDCGKICDEYAKKDSRIKVMHKVNGGLSDARNAGLDIANGEYISFVDSDDYISEQMIEILYDKILQDDSDMVLCNFEYVNEQSEHIEHLNLNSPITMGIFSKEEILEKLSEPYNWYYVVAWNKLYKKKIFDKIRFPKGKIHEDEFVAHKVIYECNRISCVSQFLYKYLQRDGSIMTSKFDIKRMVVIEAYLERTNFLLENGYINIAEKSALFTRNMYLNYHSQLDVATDEDRKTIKRINSSLRKLYLKMIFSRISLRRKMQFVLFSIDINNSGLVKTVLFLSNVMRKFVLCKILLRSKNIICKKVKECRFLSSLKQKIKKTNQEFGYCVFLLATPCHGNLGDHAIVYSEYQFLKKSGFSNQVIEIPNSYYLNNKKKIRKQVKSNDIIIIDGGGNLGTLWPCEDDKITEIISTYKNNRIIVFPQTCYYDDSASANERLERNRKVYQCAEDLVITLREKDSYDFCVENFDGVQFELLPDIVLSISEQQEKQRQNKCLLCFREDLERVVSDEDIEFIHNYLDNIGISYEKTSTVLDAHISAEQRQLALTQFWDNLSKSKILLTDRLHGMIFAAITGTPCLALDNKSKKVSGVYEWISELEYIRICSSVDEMVELVTQYYAMGGQVYDTELVDEKYDKLLKLLKISKRKD